MKKPVCEISDHALLRYLERVLQVDVEAHRRILGARCDRAAREGASSVVVAGIRYVIDCDVVVTCYKVHRPDPRKGRRRGRAPAEE